MRVLHIANVRDRPQSGITNAVPNHLTYQAPHADVALLNATSFTPKDTESVFDTYFLDEYQSVSSLPNNFSNPDLVVFHEIYWPSFIKLYKELIKKRIPYIVIPHGSSTKIAQSQKRMKKALGNLFLFNKFMKNAAAIQYLSDFDKEQSAFPNIPPIVQGSGIVSRKSEKTSFSKKGLKLIYVGRLDVTVKGLDLMIEAVKQHKSAFEDNNISITIAGADPKGEIELKNTIETHNLAGIITLEPAIYGDDKINKILEHDIFFQLSRTEAQCLGLMEAMDIGMPSLVTKGTSFFDIAKKHKIAIPVESTPESIGDIILSSLKDKHSLSTIGSNASKYIKGNYNWDIVGSAMIEEYRTLLKDGVNAK